MTDLERLRVVTWNVWFAPYEREARTAGLLRELARFGADVVALQEVLPETLALIAADPRIREHFTLSDTTGDTLGDYGVVVLSRLPMSRVVLHDLPTSHGRRLLVTAVDVGGAKLGVSTVHLESLEFNSARRQEQLETSFEVLRDGPEEMLFMGDMNFADGGEEELSVDPAFTDLALAASSKPPFTVDGYRNTMRKAMHGSSKRARYDRVFLRSPSGRWKAESVALLGADPIPGARDDLFVSDHFGVGVVLARSGPR